METVKMSKHRIVAFLLAAVMLLTSISFPAASTQLEESIPFEYGQGAITNLTDATVSGQSSAFTFNGYQAYPILAETKGDRYLHYRNAGYYIGEDNQNHAVDMRIYLWRYQEDGSGNVTEEDKVHPFVYITEDGIAHIASNNQRGNYETEYGKMFAKYPSRSNGGVHMEYHFYESGTSKEVDFKGTMTYNDLDGLTDIAGAVNEGIAITGGVCEVVKTTTSVIEEVERAGLTWYQGSMMTEDILGEDGLDQNAQKLTVKFATAKDDPFSVVYRCNTIQADGRIASYENSMQNETVEITYSIKSEDLPSLSSNKGMTALIHDGGGAHKRYLNYGTDTASAEAQESLNVPAEAVTGYTFDGWYTSNQFTDASKWTGTQMQTSDLKLYGRYVKNKYKLTVNFYEVKEDGTLTTNVITAKQEKEFEFGDRVATKVVNVTHNAHDVKDADGNTTGERHDAQGYAYQPASMRVNGGALSAASLGGETVHFDSTNTIAGDVTVDYFYRDVSNTGSVEVHHVEAGSGSDPSAWKPLHDGKYDATYRGLLNETVHLSGLSLKGWKLTQAKVGPDWEHTISTGVTSKYTNPKTVVYFVYEPDKESAGLTVNYVYDGKSEVPVTTASNLTGSVGTAWDADAIRVAKQNDDLYGAFTGLTFLGVKVYNTDETYRIIPKGGDGYEAATRGALTEAGQSVTFVYKTNSTNIVVRHVSVDTCDDGDGNTSWVKILKEEHAVQKPVGSVFVAKSSSFEGYALLGNSGNTKLTVTDEDAGKTIYIYYYYSHLVNKVTVHHKDGEGNKFVYKDYRNETETLYDDAVDYYHYGESWTARIRDHWGYNVESPNEATGTMNGEDVEITYVYTPKQAKIIAHYQDEDGREILSRQIPYDEWVYGDTYTIYADSSKLTDEERNYLNSEWRLISADFVSGVVNCFFDGSKDSRVIDVYFRYTQAEASVTVKHVWMNGLGIEEDITTPEIYTGQIGVTEWNSEPWSGADAAGYVLSQTPTITSGTMDQESLVVKYVYVKKEGKLQVKYMRRDEAGELQSIGLTDTLMDVVYNNTYSVSPKTYPDYAQAKGYHVTEATFTDNRGNDIGGWTEVKNGSEVTGATGTISADDTVVTFIYEPVDVKVTTRYRVTTGERIQGPDAEKAEDWVQSYKANTRYTTHNDEKPVPEFYGYEWTKKYPVNASGLLGGDDIIVTYEYAPRQSSYIVKYMDENGNKLADDKICDFDHGYKLYVFDEYSEQPISISGHAYKELGEGSAPASGTLEELNEDGTTKTVITFVYEASASDVIVRYIDTEGNALSEPTSLAGKYGDSFTARPKEIPGYTLVTVEATGEVMVNDNFYATGIYTVVTQTVKYIYAKTKTSVVINHVDAETKLRLADTEVIDGEVGDEYKAEPVELYGYTFTGISDTSAPQEGTMKDGVTAVTLMYERNDATVTVHFVDNETDEEIRADKNNEKVTNPVVIKGKFKDTYETEPAEIYGWKVVRTPENASGAMIDGNIDVVYRYSVRRPTITAKYVDRSDMREISEPETYTGETGERYETEKKDYDVSPERYPELYGYTLVSVPENASGKFGEEDVTVTYYYEKKAMSVTVLYVEYIDGEMHEIADSVTQADLAVGDFYTTAAKTVKGYTLVEIPDNAKGYVTEKPITVIYVYEKTPAIVRVRYVNEALADIASSTVIEGHITDEYTTVAKTIPGYQLMQIPENYKGIMREEETNVMYVYKVASTTVTVKYINIDAEDEKDAQLDVSVSEVPFGSDYTTEQKDFEGFTCIGDSGNTAGVADNANGTIVYYYYSAKNAFVTTRFVELDTDRQLAPPVVKSGTAGTKYETQAKDLTGYTLDHVEGETSGEFKADENILVTYYYTADPAQVIVRYVDTNKAEIAEEVVIDGYVGDVYDTEQKAIDGYVFQTVEGEPSGSMTPETIYVYYIYRQKEATVVTNYVDENGLKLEESVYATYKKGEPYKTEAKEIYGYELTKTPENASGRADKELINVNYVYKKLEGTVTVNYIDDETEEAIAQGKTITGPVFSDYETEAKEISGYTLVKTPANASGKITVEPITVTYRYKADEEVPDEEKAKVTVKYVDENGEDVASPVTFMGRIGETYKTEPVTIPDYELVKTPENASGTIEEGETVVIYVYKKADKPAPPDKPDEPDKPENPDNPGVDNPAADAKVIVRYVDEDGNQLLDDKILKGKAGDEYTTSAEKIEGYELARMPGNASGKMTEKDITVVYVYREKDPDEESADAKVIIQYVDEDGKKLNEDKILTGKAGDAYEAPAAEIKGYIVKEIPGNAKGTMTEEDIVVVYVYQKAEGDAVITVKYIDRKLKELAERTKINKKIGEKYTTSPKTIPNYVLVSQSENWQGIVTGSAIEVLYTYEPFEAKVIVKYVDKDGKELLPSETLKGKVGDDYEAKAKNIEGFKLVKTPSNAKGKMSEKETVVVFTYEKATTKASVRVLYVDKDGKAVAAASLITGEIGEKYEAKAKTVEGYELTAVPSNAKGIMTKDDITVTFVYAKKTKVTIKYVDEDGNVIKEEVIEGIEGDSYTTKEKDIDGYTLVKKPDNASGKMTADGTTVVYVYKKAAEKNNGTLSLKKTASAQTVTLGDKVTYTVVVSSSALEAKNVVIQDAFETVTQTSGIVVRSSYVLDTATKTFHSTSCKHLDKIKTGSKAKTSRSYSVLTKIGYKAASDCSPSDTAISSAKAFKPNMDINKSSVVVVDAKGKAVKGVKTDISSSGSMTITIPEIKKDSVFTITYTASSNDARLVNQKVTNGVTARADGMDKTVKASASILMKAKASVTPNKPSTPSTRPSAQKPQTTQKHPQQQVTGTNQTTSTRTSDTYTLIFIMMSGTALAGALGYLFLKKKKK